MKFILALFLSLLLLTSIISPANADTNLNFNTSYTVTYDPREDETTKVTLGIDLKNLTTDFYAESYQVQTGYKNIESINASDSKGVLSYKTTENEKGTLISFDFNENVVGINKSQKFNISFETDQIAKKEGQIWELNIPGVSDQAEYESFSAIVNMPASFGKPIFVKPATKNVSSASSTLKFTKEELGESGVSISYGTQQIYEFNLKYNLENKNLFPITTEIALPSDNSYQEVLIQNINPKPLDVDIDTDGNWIAKFKINPSQKITVAVDGKARISLNPKKETISKDQIARYTKPQKYWESENNELKKLAVELKTPKNIHDYIVKTLSYDNKRVSEDQVRAGALGVFKNPKSAVCLEFTDLFIALARSAGIPARQVEGYANTNNSTDRPLSLIGDVLHSWPQYYDFKLKAWVNVDPTWENTTNGIDYFNVFDFDHLAFVIKGDNSEYPIPAGGYKFGDKKGSKDVNVFPSNFFEKQSPVLSINTEFKDRFFGGFPVNGKIIITNASSSISPNQSLNISTTKLSPSTQDLFVEKLPPYGVKELNVKFKSEAFLTEKSDTLIITLLEREITKDISILPIYKSVYFYLILGVLIGTITAIIISIYYYKSRDISIPR